MADDIRALSAELAGDPASLVFLRLGEALRQQGQTEAAARVAVAGLEQHPNLADGHDLYARILADLGDLERAQDEWGFTLAIDPRHQGAHKGLGFLGFHRRDFDAALDHLELALAADPTDGAVVRALQTVRQAAAGAAGVGGAAASRGSAAPAATFAGLDAAETGTLLVDVHGRVLAGGLRDGAERDVADEVAAYLAGVSQEAERTARLLELGTWRWIVTEAERGSLHLSQPAEGALLLLARDRSVPVGRLAILAARAAEAARRWLELQR